jgi:ribonuclease HI
MDNFLLVGILNDISQTYGIDFEELKQKYLPKYKQKKKELKIKRETITSDLDNQQIIFTDGGCINNGKKNARGGVGVYFFKSKTKNYSAPQKPYVDTTNGKKGKPSNQRGELEAIAYAIKNSTSNNIVIYTDSNYSINCITKWIKNWKKKGWKNSKGQPVAHSDLIQEIDEYRNIKTIQFKHINSHQPEPVNTGSWEHTIWKGNKIADQLATEGCNMNFKQE